MRLARLFLAAAVILMAACATVPRSIDISRSQLQAALDRRFPVERRFLDLIEVRASNPVVVLLPEANRIGVEMSLSANDRLTRQPVAGALTMSFAPRYEASDQTIRLGQVRIERFDLPMAPPAWRGQIERIAGGFGELALEGAVLHQFRHEEIARVQGWTPGDMRVLGNGIRISLTPPK